MNTQLLYKAGLIVVYLALNKSLNILNKYVIGLYGFSFPITLSVLHQTFCFIGLIPPMLLRGSFDHAGTLQKQWRGLCATGLFFAASLALNNYSLITVPLSLNQVVRASLPVVTAILAVFIENRTPSRNEFISLCVLSFGVMIALYEGYQTVSTIGLLACVAGTIANGLLMSASGRLMSERIESSRLTFYLAPVASAGMLPFFFIQESSKLGPYLEVNFGWSLFGLVFGTCAIALVYNIVHNEIIHVLSAVTTTVLGELKIIGLLILSAVFLGEGNIWTYQMLAGCTVTIVGFCMYSHVKLYQRQAALAASTSANADTPKSLTPKATPLQVPEGEEKQPLLSTPKAA